MVPWFTGRWHSVGSLVGGVSISFLGILNLVVELSSNGHHYVCPLSPKLSVPIGTFWTIFRSPRWSHYFSTITGYKLFVHLNGILLLCGQARKKVSSGYETQDPMCIDHGLIHPIDMTIVSEFSFWCVIRDKHSFLATSQKADIAKEQDFNLLMKCYLWSVQTWRWCWWSNE